MVLKKFTDRPDLSICIVSYNTCERLRALLTSIFSNTADLTVEVIVVDNASTDATQAMVRRKFPQVRLIENRKNLFFTKANNQAIRASTGRYVLICNSDIMVVEDSLSKLAALMDARSDIGAASCMLVNPDGQIQSNGWRFRTLSGVLLTRQPQINLFGNSKRVRDELLADWDRTSSREVEVAVDAFLMIRREALEAIGSWYDEAYMLYYTEDDLCRRLWDAGRKVYYYADAKVLHQRRGSTSRLPTARRLWIEGKDAFHYFRKHHGWWTLPPLWCAVALEVGLVALYHWVLKLQRLLQLDRIKVKGSSTE